MSMSSDGYSTRAVLCRTMFPKDLNLLAKTVAEEVAKERKPFMQVKDKAGMS